MTNGPSYQGALSGTDFGPKYFGFRLDQGAGDFLYGWFEVERNSSTEYTINQWAYEDTLNLGIQAGNTGAAVPEPAGTAAAMGLLAAGEAGVRRWKARRKNRAAA